MGRGRGVRERSARDGKGGVKERSARDGKREGGEGEECKRWEGGE